MVERFITDAPDLFIVKVILKGNPGSQKLIILLDGDQGVTIDQCSKVSRAVSAELEENDLIDGKYFLEVSSAGLDFPLQSLRQYKKNVGRSLKVTTFEGEEIEGKLKEVIDNRITLEVSSKKTTELKEIEIDKLSKSMVLVSFK